MHKLLRLMSIVLFSIAFVGISQANEGFTVLPSGLEYKDLKVGVGMKAQPGAVAVIHFIGWVDENGRKGKEIFNSRKEKNPVSFVIGTDKVMQGWNEGVVGMQEGGSRMLRIPPELGYGSRAVEDVVPPHSRLLFIIDLLELREP